MNVFNEIFSDHSLNFLDPFSQSLYACRAQVIKVTRDHQAKHVLGTVQARDNLVACEVLLPHAAFLVKGVGTVTLNVSVHFTFEALPPIDHRGLAHCGNSLMSKLTIKNSM